MSRPHIKASALKRGFATLRAWTLTSVTVLFATAFVFAVANVIAFGLLTAFPELNRTAEEKITREFNIQFSTRQSNLAMEWLAIADQDELQAFFVENTEHSVKGNVYEDFTLFKTMPWSGRFFNFTSDGYRAVRNQGPWPPSPHFFNVFFFGGSTTMGIGPDWATIPSYFQEQLNGTPLDSRPVRVYNFGRGAYFSSQERILFQQLLLKHCVPDMAIFLDGLNDFYSIDGRPSSYSYFESAFDKGMALSSGVRPPGRTIVHAIMDRIALLPIGRAATIVGEKISKPEVALPIYKPEQTSRRDLDAVIDRYIESKRQIEAISCAYGISPLFVWQPIPGYKYDLKYHISLNPVYGLGGHERSAQGYPVAAERRAEFGKSFLWLADIQQYRTEPLYMDAVHYTAAFSKAVAAEIVAHVQNSRPPTQCNELDIDASAVAKRHNVQR
jgi:hypothetical protein